MRNVTRRFCIVLVVGLVAACGGVMQPGAALKAGPLGAVEVGMGKAVQIRSLFSHTVVPGLAEGTRYSMELAVRDFGNIHGYEIELDASIDSMCTGKGGRIGAEKIIADPQVVGVIGTSCSGAAVVASPLLSEAGLVMISPINTSPALTSDLIGNPSPSYRSGYFRTANNDVYEANAVADFAYRELGLRRMVSIDDGDPYTMGLTIAFGNAFRALGGEVPFNARIAKGDTDLRDILAGFAAAEPDGIYFPLFDREGAPFAEQAQAFEDLDKAVLITTSSVLLKEFLVMPQSVGVYIAGPEPAQGSNVNDVTGKSVDEVLAAFIATYGGPPNTPYWVHSYDATTLLLSAIEAVGKVADGKLVIDRAALREEIGATDDFQGLLGTLACDDFGDCGTGRINIYYHTDPAITDPARLPVVYESAP